MSTPSNKRRKGKACLCSFCSMERVHSGDRTCATRFSLKHNHPFTQVHPIINSFNPRKCVSGKMLIQSTNVRILNEETQNIVSIFCANCTDHPNWTTGVLFPGGCYSFFMLVPDVPQTGQGWDRITTEMALLGSARENLLCVLKNNRGKRFWNDPLGYNDLPFSLPVYTAAIHIMVLCTLKL